MRKLLSFFVLVFMGLMLFAQAPQKFTYQAVVRNESNTLVRGTVGVRVSILQGNADGAIVYQETHTTVTNINGLMTLEIGGGTVVNGDFASIDWANGPFFLKTEIDPTGGTYYVLENVQQLLSVPYALYAGSAANSFSGNYNDLTNTPDIPQIPENVSAFNNDAGYITMDSIPEIPTVPTNVSAFVNDAGYVTQSTLNTENYITQNDLITNNYVTEADIPTNVSAFTNDAGYITMDSIPDIPTVPTNVSAFVNDAGYVTESTLTNNNYITQNDLITNNYVTEADIPTNVSAFTNDAGYITMDSIPEIPTVPTNVSAFVNDAGYVTQSTLTIENYITQNDLITNNYVTEADIPTNVSAFTNDAGYITRDSIPAIPTVPTNVSAFVNDAGYLTTATVQEAANIPTNVSAFANDANYITLAQVPEQVNADWNATSGAAQIMNKPTLFDGDYNSLANRPELFSGDYNDLTNKPQIPQIPANVSAFNNDAGYVTESMLTTNNYITQNDLITNNYVTEADIPTNVSAFTNDANYITAADVPAIPTNVSAFTNDAGYITMDSIPEIPAVPTNISAFVNDAGYLTTATVQEAANIPTNVSAFTNDANYITAADVPAIPTNVSAFENDANYITSADVPVIPTNVSAFTNDAGYLTSFTEQQVLTISNDTLFLTGGSFVKLPAGFDGNYNSLTNRPELFSGSYNDLTDKPTIPTVPANVSAFENDANYITAADVPAIPTNVSAFANDANYITSEDIPAYQVLSISNDTIYLSNGGYAVLPAGFDGNYNSLSNKPDLFSGSYNDLTDKPTIPTVPTNVSAFTNDANYITSADVPAIPTNVSSFTNDANYITSADVPAIPTNVSSFTNDANYITLAQVPAQVNADWNATSGAAQIMNKPTIPTVPTNVSAFTNDANYITSADVPAIPTNVSAFTNDAHYLTEYTEQQVLSISNDTIYLTGGSFAKLPAGFSGSYNDLTDRPDIPTIPTNVSTFTNDAGYITMDSIPALPTVPTNVSAFSNDAHYLTEVDLQSLLGALTQTLDSLQQAVEDLEVGSGEAHLPRIITRSVGSITDTTAICGGEVRNDGNDEVIARGVCWSTSPNPTIADAHTTDGVGLGFYSGSLQGLVPGETYYVRAYATNYVGTSYGNQLSFTTSEWICGTGTLVDYDGNVYNTVLIGSQCWMKENLRTTHYADGNSVSDGTLYHWAYPSGDASNKPIYGLLYNWSAAMRGATISSANPSGVQGACPTGWHMPSDAEWNQLTNYVSSQSQYQCNSSSSNIAKALACTTGWNSSTTTCNVGDTPSSNDATGFSAMPAGYFYTTKPFYYYELGVSANFWTTSNAKRGYNLRYDRTNTTIFTDGTSYNPGYSIRCVRD